MRVCILGNSGSGKSTLAARLAQDSGAAVLELDAIYFEPHQIAVPRAMEIVLADLRAFIAAHESWVIEGCYADVIQAALPVCDELVFLDPGIDACVANARKRPFEPHKYDRPEDQEKMLSFLIDWIHAYAERADNTGHDAHQRVYDAFPGRKRRVTDNGQAA